MNESKPMWTREVPAPFDDETKVMSWRERRAFHKTERRVKRANAKLLKAAAKEVKRMRKRAAKTERVLARNPGMREAAIAIRDLTNTQYSAAPIALQAAQNTLDRIGRMRDRRFRYVATIGTWITAILIALLVTCSACAPRPTVIAHPRSALAQFDAATLIEKRCVLFEENAGKIFDHATGTGIVVDATHVLTAAHVVSCTDDKKPEPRATPVVRIEHKGLVYYARIARVDTANDTALLVLNQDTLIGDDVQLGTPKVGDAVCASVFVPKREQKCGVITGITAREISTTLAVRPGNSGAGLYNQRGELVGVVRAVLWCSMFDALLYNFEDTRDLAESCDGVAAIIRPEVVL